MVECVNSARLQLINKYSGVISQIEAELLLAYMFRCTRLELYIKNYPVDEETEKTYHSLIERRLSGEPFQYIIGSSEFMGLEFIVNKDVFIPRPETEVLVNEIFRFANDERPRTRRVRGRRTTNDVLKILDLCTGCGNIAISLARLMPGLQIIATDISARALEMAQRNSIAHSADRCTTFYKADLFRALPFDKGYKFDIIVCNPPYIKGAELRFLQGEVKSEPEIALDGGVDGLEFYRRIEKEAPLYLKPGGSLFLEVGFGQAQAVRDIFSSRELFEIRKIKKDFAGIDRVIALSLRGE